MKKVFLIVVLSFLSFTILAQQKEIAVCVLGPDKDVNKVLGSKLTQVLSDSSMFSVKERSRDIISRMKKEHSYKRTGLVDYEEIARVGKQLGVTSVCVAFVDKAFEIPYVSARLIDAETMELKGIAMFSGMLISKKDVMNAGESLAHDLLSSMPSERMLAWEKILVYVPETKASKGFSNVLGDKLFAGLLQNSSYIVVECAGNFNDLLNAEKNNQCTNDDRCIANLGKQIGVKYVCVADVSNALGEKSVFVRIIDVQTAEVINGCEISEKIDSFEECTNATMHIIDELFKETYIQSRMSYSYLMDSLEPVNIPEWFMNISEGTYVGVSMPNGDEIDALGMTLFQKLLATDVPVQFNSIQKDTIIDNGFQMGADSVSIYEKVLSFTKDISYNILDVAKLPNGYYVCRITDGTINKLQINVGYYSYNEIQVTDSVKERFGYKIFKMKFGDCQRELKMYEIDNDKGKSVYKSYYYCNDTSKKFSYNYGFENFVDNSTDYEEQYALLFQSKRKSKDIKMPYIFPYTQKTDETNSIQYNYSMDPKKCLAEQIWLYYLDIMTKKMPVNYEGTYLREKTPIVSQEYKEGQFIINCLE